MSDEVRQEDRDRLAAEYRADGLGRIADWIVSGDADDSSHTPALLALATTRAEAEAKDARIEALEGALQRAAEVLHWLTENEPDCYGWNPPFPSTSPGIAFERDLARQALNGETRDATGAPDHE